jgi:hypothetical protein
VTVTALDDGIDELDQAYTITNTLSSSDSNFDGVIAASVSVMVGDSDVLIVTIEGPTVGAPGLPAKFTATVNAGGTGTITYSWTAILDGKQFASGDQATFEFTPTVADSAIVSVQVGDAQGQNPLEFLPFTVLNDSGNIVFTSDIVWLAEEGITKGCNPPANNEFCPTANVTRAQMAAFLVRFLGLTNDGGGNTFTDDDGSIFEGDIARLAAAGITKGCNPPTNDHFCPKAVVTRGQMAAFLRRADAIVNP